jgi:hypothetical protein
MAKRLTPKQRAELADEAFAAMVHAVEERLRSEGGSIRDDRMGWMADFIVLKALRAAEDVDAALTARDLMQAWCRAYDAAKQTAANGATESPEVTV